VEARVTVSDIQHPNNSVNAKSDTVQSDLLWGADEIGKNINRNERAVFHLYRTRALKSIRKVNGKLVASRAALLKELAG